MIAGVLLLAGLAAAAVAAWPRGLGIPARLSPWAVAGTGAGAALAAAVGLLARGGPGVLIGPALVLVAAADARCRVIPHRWVLMLAATGLATAGPVLPTTALAAGLTGAALLGVAWLIPEGLGLGDVKLAPALMAALGWPVGLFALALGLWLGAAGALVQRLRTRQRVTIPLAPYWAAGTLLVWAIPLALHAA